jgi:FkbM family methyltransferase
LNAAVHHVATGGVREQLRSVGVYDPLYRAYMAILGRVYRRDTYALDVGGASATLSTATPAETVSVLHSVEKERDLLARFVGDLRGDDVVWDVGANLGVYGAVAGRVVDEVVAVEPYPPTVDRLRQNLARNGVDGEVLGIALGGEGGAVELGIERADVGTQTPAVGADYGETVTVPQKTGDQLIREHGVSVPTVLKVDVEGGEMAVLEGLAETLASVRLIYVECHGDGGRVREFLRERGFELETIDVDGHQVMIRAERTC